MVLQVSVPEMLQIQIAGCRGDSLSHGVDCTEKSAPAATAIETLCRCAALFY
jgi:hypothetical protein